MVELNDLFARFDIPEPNGFVVTAGQYPSAIRGECDSCDCSAMFFKFAHQLARLGVPQPEVCFYGFAHSTKTHGRRNGELSVGGEIDTSDERLMSGKPMNLFASFRFPQLNCSVCTS